MLILSRKQDDSVIIGDDIEIRIISIDKGSVRLGFSAPASCVILRGELKEAISSQNKQACQNVPLDNLSTLKSLLKAKKS
ncbi:carbon storage regulator [Helicobacter jaachi]|uniref:Translational regulator CsrA n=1 Tax=Helicobacter jaachi TaxID=1677920 RepID=A0A4U8TD81_9HELI|nr:carbon storage regulator [Helicobacter jaachi]TLD96607.1 carbon storage regulator [Helicobacter jaachi]